jgi:hypothetical protein
MKTSNKLKTYMSSHKKNQPSKLFDTASESEGGEDANTRSSAQHVVDAAEVNRDESHHRCEEMDTNEAGGCDQIDEIEVDDEASLLLMIIQFIADSLKDTHIDMPADCPMDDCADKFPTDPSKSLRGMVRHYNEILAKTRNPMSAPALRQAIAICGEVKSQVRREEYLALTDKPWPYPIDFMKLTERIVLMKSELAGIIESEGKRSDSIAYQRLIKAMGGRAALKNLGAMIIPPPAVMDNCRPG